MRLRILQEIVRAPMNGGIPEKETKILNIAWDHKDYPKAMRYLIIHAQRIIVTEDQDLAVTLTLHDEAQDPDDYVLAVISFHCPVK